MQLYTAEGVSESSGHPIRIQGFTLDPGRGKLVCECAHSINDRRSRTSARHSISWPNPTRWSDDERSWSITDEPVRGGLILADLQPSNGQHPSSPFRPNLRGLDTAHGGGITGEHESGHHACHTPIHLALVILTTTQTYFSHQFLPPSSADPGPRCGQTHDGESLRWAITKVLWIEHGHGVNSYRPGKVPQLRGRELSSRKAEESTVAASVVSAAMVALFTPSKMSQGRSRRRRGQRRRVRPRA
jgi:hypothetical protein